MMKLSIIKRLNFIYIELIMAGARASFIKLLKGLCKLKAAVKREKCMKFFNK
jgi:hypothetical protein